MKKITLSLLVALLLPAFSFAQSSWNAKPKVHTLSEELKKESIVLVLDERKVELEWDEKEKEMYQNRSIHRIASLLDDKGVESFNTLVIGSGRSGMIKDIKARTIKADGKVIELSKNQIKTSKDENGNLQYHIAFENVSKGDEVEYYFNDYSPVNPFGSEVMQFSVPIVEAKFELISPSHLSFDCKGYNGFPSATLKSTDELKTYTAVMKNVPAVKDEEYADIAVYSMRIDYKLSYVSEKQNRLYTWTDLVKSFSESLYTTTDKENKAIQKYLKSLGLAAGMPEDDMIKKLEGTIKKDFIINEALSDANYSKLDYIIEKKTSHEKGIMKLFVNCLEALGIKHEPGYTANRFKHLIDEEMENWNYLDVYIIYLPKTQSYLLPTGVYFRYPMVGSFVEGNKGIFSKKVSLGNLSSYVSTVREIPVSPQEDNWSKIKADIHFDATSFEPNINFDYSFAGSSSVGIREAIGMSTKENEKELVTNVLNIVDQESDILKYSFTNRGLEVANYAKPVGIIADIKADKLMEKAGAKYLFKLGDVIGPQMEMYKEENRVLPISIESPHILYRELIVNIPKGYRVANPETVNMNVSYGDNAYGFISTHKIEGNKLIVTIKEHYAKTIYDKSEIEPFRKVINAAADFNKVSLVFEKI